MDKQYPFLASGNILTPGTPPTNYDNLPNGVYRLRLCPKNGFFLEQCVAPKLPAKVYGDAKALTNRILTAHKALGEGLGVLLSGSKGTGKTVTARMLALKSPIVIIIDAPYGGSQLGAFLAKVPTCTVFIDEFEKIYADTEQRNPFLSLLDGATNKRHLFVLTSNTESIGEYFMNRPGRIRYHVKFGNLPYSVMDEVIDDMVEDKELNATIKKYAGQVPNMSYDGLTSVIKECLIFNESPASFMSIFNVTAEDNRSFNGVCHIKIPTLKLPDDYVSPGGDKLTALNHRLHELVDNYLNYNSSSPLIQFIDDHSDHVVWVEKSRIIYAASDMIRTDKQGFMSFASGRAVPAPAEYDEGNRTGPGSFALTVGEEGSGHSNTEERVILPDEVAMSRDNISVIVHDDILGEIRFNYTAIKRKQP